ncbi:uncharacterized protein LOC117179759 [Belonocnema kinseyi]|uniref:uncharacterized protein LOC117179759 n=1 Tax=Belonocnema kinseyi TaxID=2817044 RepID=UPI00143D288C|nr:uncharacterized protein LOC117179759 [Belonocnema kinseyi]
MVNPETMATGPNVEINLGQELLRAFEQLGANQGECVDSYRVPKIPPFFRNDPSLWFMQVEASCRALVSGQATMADCIISHLDSDVIAHVKDILTASPAPADIYDQIKHRIVSGFAESAETRFRRLLKGEVSFEGKPSVLLNRLCSYNDGGCTEEVMKTIFMNNLPKHVTAILAGNETADLQTLARLADNIVVAVPTPPMSQFNTAAITKETPSETSDAKLDWLVNEFKQLKSQVSKLQSNWSRNPSRSDSQNRGNRNRSQSRDGTKFCFYHKRYGSKAKSYRQPCSWIQKSSPEN